MTRTVTPGSSLAERRHDADSSVIKRSIIRDGHKSSVSLEDEFWIGLREIAGRENMTVSALVGTIDHGSNRRNLSSAIRVFVLSYFRNNHEHELAIDAPNSNASAANVPQVS